jgi:hypothetical protein
MRRIGLIPRPVLLALRLGVVDAVLGAIQLRDAPYVSHGHSCMVREALKSTRFCRT